MNTIILPDTDRTHGRDDLSSVIAGKANRAPVNGDERRETGIKLVGGSPSIDMWQYQDKLVTPEEAAGLVTSGDLIFYSEFVLFPKAIDAALARRVEELHDVEIRSTCFTQIPKAIEADPTRKHIRMSDWHFGSVSRRLHDSNLCNYVPLTYHQAPRIIRKYHSYDVIFLSVAPMDARGYFNFGLSNSLICSVLSKAKKSWQRSTNLYPIASEGIRNQFTSRESTTLWKETTHPLQRFSHQNLPKPTDRSQST